MILYAGSYTEKVGPGLSGKGNGISSYMFNDETGDLHLFHTFLNRNTSYISISKDKQYLYSFQEVLEDKKPIILAFRIQEDCSIKLIDKFEIKGGLPCHLSLINNDESLAVACYEKGVVHTISIDEDGCFDNDYQFIEHNGKSINVERQECAHAHMVAELDSKLFVPDLGLDKIVVYNFLNKELIEDYKIEMPLGAGPRHIVFHPSGNYAFVMNKLTSGISVLKKVEGKFQVIQNVSSLPKTYKGIPSGAAIKISSDGKFIYASNRGSNTIAILNFDQGNEKLELVEQQDTFGETPRDFTLSPSGKWLIVANQDSNNIVVFRRGNETGLLIKVNENKQTKSVVCLEWL